MTIFLPNEDGWGRRESEHHENVLLPNLDALLEQLAGDAAGKHDARTLAEAAARANTGDELDEVLARVIASWRHT